MSSVKNFQLVEQTPPEEEFEEVVLEFGKSSNNEFSLTLRYPFSILNAFAIALSAFDK